MEETIYIFISTKKVCYGVEDHLHRLSEKYFSLVLFRWNKYTQSVNKFGIIVVKL